jgi:hypothetical protein
LFPWVAVNLLLNGGLLAAGAWGWLLLRRENRPLL